MAVVVAVAALAGRGSPTPGAARCECRRRRRAAALQSAAAAALRAQRLRFVRQLGAQPLRTARAAYIKLLINFYSLKKCKRVALLFD